MNPAPIADPDMPAAPPAAETARFEVLLTAGEAFPAFEGEFLAARREISAGFRIFDLDTKLRSDAAREVGDDWFDLIRHTLSRGVHLRMVLADFDPILAADLHQLTWRSVRQFRAAAELAGSGNLRIVPSRHAARMGPVPRALFAPAIRRRLGRLAREVNARTRPERELFLEETPGLAPYHDHAAAKLRPRLGIPWVYPATHHQKLAVFDRERLYIGGLDLNERRWDTREHRRSAALTWHDVQCLTEGPAVAPAQAHLDSFLDTIARKGDPAPRKPGFARTLSRRHRRETLRMSPVPFLREIEAAHYENIAAAEKLIYLESQFFRHMPLARALARRARQAPGLRLIVLLPAAPEDVAFERNPDGDARFGEYLQARCMKVLRRAFGEARHLVVAPVQPRDGDSDGRDTLAGGPLIYVHSKVSIFDDAGALVSSANLNGRSMRWDTEAGLHLDTPAEVGELRRRVMGHWLHEGAGEEYLAPETAFDAWKALADHNTETAPGDNHGFIVHYDSEPARRLGMPLPGIPDEAV